MKAKRLLGLLLLGLTACAALPTVLDKPQVSVSKIELTGVSKEGASFQLSLDVYNPNSVSLTVQSLDAELTVSGKLLAQGQSQAPVRLDAKAHAKLTLAVLTEAEATRLILLDLIKAPTKKYPYRLLGHVVLTDLHLERTFERTGEESLLTWIGHQNPSSSKLISP